MYAILLSAANYVLSFILRTVVFKFGVLTLISVVVYEVLNSVLAYLPGLSSVNSAMAVFPPTLWYFLDLMKVQVGIPLMVSAFATRFLIRRIPFIG